jgi:hypothetical protein
MTDTTPRSGLPLLAAAQAQKHVTHNEALLKLDALLFARFLDRDLAAPPGAPADGDTYLVAAAASGAWSDQDGVIAYAVDGAWRFFPPFAGLVAFVVDEASLVVFDGAAWRDYAEVLNLQGVPRVGINASADATNRLAVRSSAILFDHESGGVQAKLNKQASGDTASLLFQTGYSGRAEIGLSGDDKLRVKTSADGASFSDAIVVDSTGRVAIGSGVAPVCVLDVAGPVRVKGYGVATLPDASAAAGQIVYVSDETGGSVLAFSDGIDWRRATDRAIVS